MSGVSHGHNYSNDNDLVSRPTRSEKILARYNIRNEEDSWGAGAAHRLRTPPAQLILVARNTSREDKQKAPEIYCSRFQFHGTSCTFFRGCGGEKETKRYFAIVLSEKMEKEK